MGNDAASDSAWLEVSWIYLLLVSQYQDAGRPHDTVRTSDLPLLIAPSQFVPIGYSFE